ncbi:helix-turn-helix domain-containing protein [Streptomyces sp. WAC05858]|uniref:helix-turn-helix domain-containing protein n=1 Tax=Streptomyces TaxID=1883 RepID=UPI000F79F3DC|nr:helix-turn-helix transcriptional regulator [Streptomyces sp. WAC05858]RSS47573.1 XRE family transcriptional regulator [Streptomyces sp. WAC05858]
MARQFSGQRLREARTAAGLSKEALALRVGRSFYSIHEYEHGRVQPSIAVLVALSDALGRPLDDLLTEEARDAA